MQLINLNVEIWILRIICKNEFWRESVLEKSLECCAALRKSCSLTFYDRIYEISTYDGMDKLGGNSIGLGRNNLIGRIF